MSRFYNKCYKTDAVPSKILVLIHGYKGNIQDMEYGVEMLRKYLDDDVWLVLPESPEVCEKDSSKKQWYSLASFDPMLERRNVDTPLEKVVDIYNQAGEKLSQIAGEMNLFIDDLKKDYGLEDEDVFVGGFSQGAMVAIYTALSREKTLGGCVMLSGVVAGKDRLEKDMKSTPKVLLVHGQDDVTVQYKTHDFSKKWLQQKGVKIEALSIPDLAHRMHLEGMKKTAEFINSNP